MRKALKYITIFLAGLVLLVVILLLLTQTAFFRSRLKDRLVNEAEKHLNLQLEVETLNGNLYRNIELKHVVVRDQDRDVGKLASLRVSYHLLPLVNGELLVDSVVIDQPEIWLWQEKDSTWNIQSYLKNTLEEQPAKEKKAPKLRMQFSSVIVNRGNFELDALLPLIPKQIHNLNLSLEAAILDPEIRVDLQDFSFNSVEPELVINELSGIYRMNDAGIQIDSVRLRTEQSAVTLKGDYREVQNMEALIDADPIDNQELEIFLPELKLRCAPSVKVNMNTADDVLSATVNLKHDREELVAEIKLGSVSKLLEREGAVPYSARILFNNFRVENWLVVENLVSKLEGSVDVDGENLLDLYASTNVNANLKNSAYKSVKFKTFAFKGNVENDNVNGSLSLNSDFGRLAVKGKVRKISSTQAYSLNILAERFNLSAFFPQIEQTVLSGRVKTEGQGFDIKNMSTNADLELSNSKIYAFPVDALYSTLAWKNQDVRFDTLHVEAPGAQASGSGRFKIDSLLLDTRLTAHIDSLKLIEHLVNLPLIFDSVNTVSRIHGPVNRLKVEGEAEVSNARGYNAVLEKTVAKYQVDVHPDSLRMNIEAQSSAFTYSDFPFDSLDVNLSYRNNQLALAGGVLVKDTLDARFETLIIPGDTSRFSLHRFEVGTLLSDYYLEDTINATVFGTEKIELSNLVLLDASDPEFLLSAGGLISAVDTNAFKLHINKLRLSQFNRFIPSDDSISGLLNAELYLKGTARDPQINGELEISNPGYGSYSLKSLLTTLSYKNQTAAAEIDIPELGKTFHASVSAAFDAYIDSSRFVFTKPETFEAKLNVEDAQISKHLRHFIENDSISGVFNAQLTVNGDMANPQFYGTVNLDGVRYVNKNLGLDLYDLKTAVVFDGNRISIDTIYVRQPKGFVSISGDLAFDSTIVKGNIISSTLQADADNFLIAKNRSYEVLIDANTFLKTGTENPEFGGKIKILRSDIYLPAILTREIQDSEEDVPMLVEALDLEKDTAQVETDREVEMKKKAGSLLSGITGRMNVEIPRNTWVRNNNMRVELSGDVDIVKTGPYFEMFGEIKLIRGHYVLYGKKLNIQPSSVIFNGGEEFDPTLDFKAEYVFRSQDREKRYLELVVSGTLEEPEVTFFLDNSEVSESDGVSVLLFGSTADEIGFGERNGIVSSIGSNAVASMISAQLSRTIGTKFNIDMIEVTATENWKSAAFVVGKYITNDIFVIYERGFGEMEGDEIVPETFTVEYEINDKLFLRLQSGSSITSGIDMILKFEQEDKKKNKD